MSDVSEPSPVLSGEFDAGRVFLTFLGRTEQKITHRLIFQTLLTALKQQGVLLNDGKPTTLVDLGCGEGHTAMEMIEAINRVHPLGAGVDYYGLDADERFVRSTERLLSELVETHRLKIVSVQRADVLDGKSLPLVRMDEVLATVGHVLYYAHSPAGTSATRARIAAIVDSVIELLGFDGICVLAHSADRCPLARIRASVADVVEARPAGYVQRIADDQRLQLVSFLAPYTIRFPQLTAEQWESVKDPSTYGVAHGRDEAGYVAVLELLSFIAQRSLHSVADDGALGAFVDDVRAELDDAEVFHATTCYQLLLSTRRSPQLGVDVAAAVREIVASLGRITREATEIFQSAAAR